MCVAAHLAKLSTFIRMKKSLRKSVRDRADYTKCHIEFLTEKRDG